MTDKSEDMSYIFKFVNRFLWCNHSNKTFSEVLPRDAINASVSCKLTSSTSFQVRLGLSW